LRQGGKDERGNGEEASGAVLPMRAQGEVPRDGGEAEVRVRGRRQGSARGEHRLVHVAAIALLPLQGHDRPQFGPSMISARSRATGLAEGMELRVRETKNGNVPYWDFEDSEPMGND